MAETYTDKGYSVADYLAHRPRYPQKLYETVLAFHTRDGQGDKELALDLGCGPGIATADLVPFFRKAIGIDASEFMVKVARTNVPKAEFHVSSVNDLSVIQSGTVDLLTVATAAHWFPDQWWKEASRVLKPRGTVSLWVYSVNMFVDPSLPKAAILNDHIMPVIDGVGHYTTGNKIAAGMYETLPLPTSDLNFGEITRVSWNPKGRVDNSEEGGRGSLVMKETLTIQKLRQRMHTYSSIHRWRLANPTKKDTPDDPVEKTMSKLREVAGWDETDEFVCGHPLTLLLLKKL